MLEDPYQRTAADIKDPPSSFLARLRFLGPGFILVAGVVGAGEIILTTTMGAVVGFTLFWWLILSCWCKSIVQVELARYTIATGEPVMTAFSRLPGRIPVPGGGLPWFPALQLILVIPTLIRSAGIYGAAGLALSMLAPFLPPIAWTFALTVIAALLTLSGKYAYLERALTVLVVGFTATTIVSAGWMQSTEYAVSWNQLREGFQFDFPLSATAIALAVFSATGVNGVEVMNYTYWCVEKGYARFTGPIEPGREWAARAKGWIKVMQADAAVTLIMLTIATIPFYLLGASVLHAQGAVPDGKETINIISSIYTETLGPWASDIFLIGAFCVLFSTVVTSLAGGARTLVNSLEALRWVGSNDHAKRLKYWRIYAIATPLFQTATFYLIGNPVLMLLIAGTVFAAINPILAGGTLYLRYRLLDKRLSPSRLSDTVLWTCFLFMAITALLIIASQF